MRQRSPTISARLGALIASAVLFELTISIPGVSAELPILKPAPAPEQDPALEVEVETAPTIPDAETLSKWIHQESLDALAQRDPSPDRRGTIRVSISGNLYEYQVSITTIREGSEEEDSSSWPCECSNDDLLARIRTKVQVAANSLESPGSLDVETYVVPSLSTPVVSDHHSSPLHDLQVRGKVGLGLITGGAAGVLSGIVLMGIGVRTREYDRDSAKLIYNDYRVPGIPTFLTGVGLLAAGMTLFILDRRRGRLSRDVACIPHVVPRRQGVFLGLTKRF